MVTIHEYEQTTRKMQLAMQRMSSVENLTTKGRFMVIRMLGKPHMPDMLKDGWGFEVDLYVDGKTMTGITYDCGPAFTAPPTMADIVCSLLSDAANIEATTFEEWCGEYGYDPDSRKAEKTYRACQDTRVRLVQLLGKDVLDSAYADNEGIEVWAETHFGPEVSKVYRSENGSYRYDHRKKKG